MGAIETHTHPCTLTRLNNKSSVRTIMRGYYIGIYITTSKAFEESSTRRRRRPTTNVSVEEEEKY